MSASMGIAIGAREVRGVVVRAGKVIWNRAVAFDSVSGLETAFRGLDLRSAKHKGARRVTVGVAPAWVQTKQLHGVPTLKSPKLVGQLVRQNPRAFFLARADAVAVTDPWLRRDGEIWASAFEERVLHSVARALREAKLDLIRIVPTVVALASLGPDRLTWRDDGRVFDVRAGGRMLERVTRLAPNSEAASYVPPALASFGVEVDRYVDAFAAAGLRHAPLAWSPPLDPRSARLYGTLRLATSIVAVASTTMFAMVAPGIHAMQFTRVAQHDAEALPSIQTRVSQEQLELRRVTASLNRIQSFAASRGRVSQLLGALSQAIPESTAMTTFHVDSVEGTFTAVAPHVADVLPELASVDGVYSARIIGSVTREVIANSPLERASFRFRRMAPPTRGKSNPSAR